MFKLTLFMAVLAVIIVSVKRFAWSVLAEKDMFAVLFQPEQPSQKNIYFTGTSRTKCAINDSLLNIGSNRFRFYNGGLGYGTFISSVAFANKVMSSVDSSVIFIELSIANGRMPYTFSLISDPVNTFSTMWPMISTTNLNDLYHIYGPFAEQYFIDYINLKPYLKLYKNKFLPVDFFGQLKKYDTLQYDPGTFLSEKEIRNAGIKNNVVPESYNTMILNLIAKANETNSHLFFVLPVSISNPNEKKRLLDIYSNIPKKNKLIYSSSFLKEISNPSNLADDMHLNVKGADIYTNFIKEVVKEKFGSFE